MNSEAQPQNYRTSKEKAAIGKEHFNERKTLLSLFEEDAIDLQMS